MTDAVQTPRASEDAALTALNALCIAIMQELRRQSSDPEAMLERLSDNAVAALGHRGTADSIPTLNEVTALAAASLGSIFSAAQRD